jgi:hypothetical protein
MQNYESDQRTANEVASEPASYQAPEPRWGEARFFEMAGASADIIIDNGGNEVSALNDW